MFPEYFLEEYGKETLMDECGFCMYILNGESGELFLSDFYIKPEYRTTLKGKKLFQKIVQLAEENKCEVVTGIVSHGIKSKERCSKILRTYIGLGFNVVKAVNNQTVLEYRIV